MENEEINTSPLYKDRDDWSDVKPIYNSEAEDAVVCIRHLQSFADAFAYFRAIMHLDEMSERAFELTTTCSQMNPANYSVWQFRRRLIKKLNKYYAEEFRFAEDMLNEHPKNYQIWHHRRALVALTGDSSHELELTEALLESDAKNYHAWQYRQWVIEKFELFAESEIAYSTRLILEDVRNNSAWNYRYFIVTNLTDTLKETALLTSEIEFTKQAITTVPANESSWCYLSGILLNVADDTRAAVRTFCEELLRNKCRSPHLLLYLLDDRIAALEQASADAKAANARQCRDHIEALSEIDPIRINYYEYLRDRVDNLSVSA